MWSETAIETETETGIEIAGGVGGGAGRGISSLGAATTWSQRDAQERPLPLMLVESLAQVANGPPRSSEGAHMTRG